ncbi:glycosyltransferase [Lacisediminimonas profundi]|uniref:glycosyltransferase n=1 Tax=Lacisediminimonas profundi TaxID=2603856 RepID=UPI00124B3763|nr:glycosyltransferase [Lacisediminimonas profundi]
MIVSIVIRTLNESRYLGELLEAIQRQQVNGFTVETVVIDSGSTDGTLEIAKQYGCTITHITRDQFSFGRSLNWGCEAAQGDILVLISGHCVPTDSQWLQTLCEPIAQEKVHYTYGRQIGGTHTRFSENRIFAKYFPDQTSLPQEGFFCNNANSALARSAWAQHKFDEEVTGLEDMELAQRLHRTGARIGYVAEACVFHYHAESWPHVRRRFEREALALQKIMPQVHVTLFDTVRYIFTSIWRDWGNARRQGRWREKAWEIVLYRYNQYLGSYRGNHQHRKLSHAEKDKYFYPH